MTKMTNFTNFASHKNISIIVNHVYEKLNEPDGNIFNIKRIYYEKLHNFAILKRSIIDSST